MRNATTTRVSVKRRLDLKGNVDAGC